MAEVGGSTPSAPSCLMKGEPMSVLCAVLSLAQPEATLPKQAVRQWYTYECCSAYVGFRGSWLWVVRFLIGGAMYVLLSSARWVVGGGF